jgi:hypothetical protein
MVASNSKIISLCRSRKQSVEIPAPNENPSWVRIDMLYEIDKGKSDVTSKRAQPPYLVPYVWVIIGFP